MGYDMWGCIEFAPRELEVRVVMYDGFGVIDFPRCYDLFVIVAGVRACSKDKPPVVAPKGMPDHLNYNTERAYDDGEGYHTPTWLTLDEAREVRRRYFTEANFVQPKVCGVWSACIAAMEQLEAYGNVARLVLWFDN